MWWIIVASVIGGLIVLGILLLSIPFDLTFNSDFYGKAKISVRWAWFFGLLSREIIPGKRKLKKGRAPGKFNLIKIFRGIRSASGFLQIKGLIIAFVRFIKRIFRTFKIRDLDIEFHVGLDDPSETFYLFALAKPVNWLLSQTQPYPISIQPSFAGTVFEGQARCAVRVYPILLVLPVMQFVFSPPVFRLIRKMLADRWKRNR